MTSYDGSIETSIYSKPVMGHNRFVHGLKLEVMDYT